MMKKIFALLLAGLMLTTLTLTACSDNKDKDNDTTDTNDSGIVEEYETDKDGNIITTKPAETDSEGNPIGGNQGDNDSDIDISEPNAVVNKDTTVKKVYVYAAQANVRSATVIADNSLGTVNKGTTLDVTGETTHWYEVNYTGKTGYIAKITAGDATLLEGFEDVNDKVVLNDGNGDMTGTVNLRTFPYVSEYSLGTVKTEGTEFTRVKKGANWSIVELDGVQYYVANSVIKVVGAESETAAG